MIEKSLIEKYGYFMTVFEVAEFLKIAPQTIYNRMSQRRFEIAAVKGPNCARRYYGAATYLIDLAQIKSAFRRFFVVLRIAE